jgi:hypothetical protein
MRLESHERARQLMVAARVEGIGAGERDWLDDHLASCGECSNEASALDAAIGSLRTLPFAASPELVRRTRLAVRWRAEQLNPERPRSAPLWIATGMSTTWMVLTAPYVWRAFAWFGRIAHIPDAMWQLGFVVWWFLPATIVAAAAAWRHKAKHEDSNWATEINWGHQ